MLNSLQFIIASNIEINRNNKKCFLGFYSLGSLANMALFKYRKILSCCVIFCEKGNKFDDKVTSHG